MHDVRNSNARNDARRVRLRPIFISIDMHYYRVNKPLKVCEHNSVIVTAEILLITL